MLYCLLAPTDPGLNALFIFFHLYHLRLLQLSIML